MDAMEEAIQRDPGVLDRWKKKGEELYQAYLKRNALMRGVTADTLVIPVVFHLVDDATKLAGIPDRSIYDQVEILNIAYNGVKVNAYSKVIPGSIYSRKGNIPIRFVLARRAPDGSLTSGIERRANTTPDRVSIKSTASGGLDAWDTNKYLNIWVGTFTGGDDGLLGIATFPFTDTEGPQGVVVGISTMPYTSGISRSYYPSYAEGATLVHEIGHFFYLYHTFGDSYVCNNNDFRIEPGWPLPFGAGPEGDDTPEEKADNMGNAHYGNPSMSYTDGCTSFPGGEMYGSFMNYFDDRALFMFSDGHRKRVVGCIQLYRSTLAGSLGAVAPTPVNDAYVVAVTPYGSPERRAYFLNNVPLTAQIRNYGNTLLTNVTVTARIDGVVTYQQVINVNLQPGTDAFVLLGNINAPAGSHTMDIFTSNPNGVADAFPSNDTLQSFIAINNNAINAPFTEGFDNAAFPPAGWLIWNPNNNGTWSYNATSGYTAAGSVSMQNFSMNAVGQLDELVMPPVSVGAADSSVLSFRYAYAVYDNRDVSEWDGLEIYLSNNDGVTYQLIYKKTGNDLKTVPGKLTTAFTAPPSSPDSWGLQQVNLTPYLIPGKQLLIKFRGVNAYGNNLYLDDIGVSAVSPLNRDVEVTSINNIPAYVCGNLPTGTVTFRTNGKDPLSSLKLNYQINGGVVSTFNWTGTLTTNNSATVSLPALPNLTPGSYKLTVYSSSPNGLADQSPTNDTLSMMFYVIGNATIPFSESFEGTTFPPAQWVLQQNGNGHSWERTTTSSSNGTSAAVIKNFLYNMNGRSDILISPKISSNTNYDSLFVSFDYAYAPGANYPGTFGNPEDTLEVKITTDCGQTFTTIFKSYGNDLVTVADPAQKMTSSFIAGSGDWKSVKVYLTPIVTNTPFQVFFSARGNNRNNLYLDNILAYGIIVPPLLKEKGYLFYPSPFRDQLIIRNFNDPTNLKSVRIYNSIGQLIWHQDYNGNAYRQMLVNTAAWPSGVYTVKMDFSDRKVVDRVVKQ